MSEVITIASGKGGVGKTTIAASIGQGLSKLGKRVLVIDMDLGLRNLDITLGAENYIVYNMLDVMNKKCSLEQALITNDKFPGLFFLSTPQTKNKTAISEEEFKIFIEEIRESYEYIILDSPSGIEQGFHNSVVMADRVIVLSTLEVASVRDADRVIGLLREAKIKKIDLIINMIHLDLMKDKSIMSVADICEIISPSVIGAIPYDKQVIVSTNQGQSVLENEDLICQIYEKICKRIIGEDIPLTDFDNINNGFFHKLSNIFR